MEKINIKNMGPIKALSIDPVEGGGIIVLVGSQGSGKSTALAAITKRLSGQETAIDLSPRDSTTKGELWIGKQAKLTVTRGQKRNTGELEVAHIEGRFDISKLVDPGIKDAVSADQARIKALIALSGATANPSDFYEACGGQEAWDELGVDCETTDPIVLAGRTSRALQAGARKCEKKSTAEFAAAKAKHDEAGKVDMSRESDSIVLQSSYDVAHTLVTELATKQLQHETQRVAIATASKSLETLPPSVSVDAASKQLADQQHSMSSTLKEIDKARADLARAESELTIRADSVRQAQQVVNLAITHNETMAGLKEVIASAQLEPVSDDTLAAAENARLQASGAIELGVAVRAANDSADEAKAHEIWAVESQKRAETLRDRSRAVDEILYGLIPAGPLRIDEGRIVTQTDRGSELFSELSDGERAKLAIEVAVPQLPEDGLLIAPQWMWEGWTDSTQEDVWAKLKRHGVVMLTAEARDGPLAVEVFEG